MFVHCQGRSGAVPGESEPQRHSASGVATPSFLTVSKKDGPSMSGNDFVKEEKGTYHG